MSPLFTPLKIDSIEISNRIVMGSMHTGLEDSIKNLSALTHYFADRARGVGPGLIVTGGYSPNYLGRLTPLAGSFNSNRIARAHRKLTDHIHSLGQSKMILQLLHAGRYSYHPLSVAPSAIKSPITPFKPWAMPGFLVESTLQDFSKAAVHAKNAGYDGVEIMGSEGYLIHQFFATRTNQRRDQWGGGLENRMRFGCEVVKRIRASCGLDFLILFRIPILDLLEDGSPWSEIEFYAKALKQAGVNILNSGIGWHESRVPTIASMVPPAAFASFTAHLKSVIDIPVIATNRFYEPRAMEAVLENKQADFVSMARPFLADSKFVQKLFSGHAKEITPCIACNQACLDHVFSQKSASCLVNPTACEEIHWSKILQPTKSAKKIAVIGSGVAGLNAALVLLKQGHEVHLFEKNSRVGGQFNLAARVPGKKDYQLSLDHWQSEFLRLGGKLFLNQNMTSIEPLRNFHHVVIATGVRPRKVQIPGAELPHVTNYEAILEGQVPVGKNVVIIGAGGIGVDVANYVLHHDSFIDRSPKDFFEHWGIDCKINGGLRQIKTLKAKRSVTILQRSPGTLGHGIGKTTGWIHRLDLKRHQVQFLNDLSYEKITETSIEVCFKNGKRKSIPCDQIIICAGQEKQMDLVEKLQKSQIPHSIIGGAHEARELNAQKAIREAFDLVASLN